MRNAVCLYTIAHKLGKEFPGSSTSPSKCAAEQFILWCAYHVCSAENGRAVLLDVTAGTVLACTCDPHRLVKEVGCICLILHSRNEGCFCASQAGPIQALEPRVQLDLPCPSVAQSLTRVELQQAIHQVLALRRDVLILRPSQLAIKNAAEDLLHQWYFGCITFVMSTSVLCKH